MKQENQTQSSQMTNQEKQGIFILLIMYFIQALPIGFFAEAVSLVMVEKGTSFSQLGLLSFCLYPWSFKIFFAPIEDIYFNKQFGKRKSYVIPIQYLMSCVFLLSSFKIQNLIENQDIFSLACLGLFMNFLSATQDIAVDGWALTLMSEKNAQWGSVCQSIGQAIGVVFSSTVFITLNSVKFCNQYIFSQPQEQPLLNASSMFQFFAVFILLSNIYIHFCVQEINPNTNEYQSCMEVISSLKGFLRNTNLRHYLLVQLFNRAGFQIIVSSITLKLVKAGYPKENLSQIQSFFLPILIILPILIGKFVKSGSEMTIYCIQYWARFFDSIFIYLILLNFSVYQMSLWNTTILIGFSTAIGSTYTVLQFVGNGSFVNRISDQDIGGTYVTFCNSITNFGQQWSPSIGMYLMDFMEYEHILIGCWVYSIIFFMLTFQKSYDSQSLHRDQWKLFQKLNKDEQLVSLEDAKYQEDPLIQSQQKSRSSLGSNEEEQSVRTSLGSLLQSFSLSKEKQRSPYNLRQRNTQTKI